MKPAKRLVSGLTGTEPWNKNKQTRYGGAQGWHQPVLELSKVKYLRGRPRSWPGRTETGARKRQRRRTEVEAKLRRRSGKKGRQARSSGSGSRGRGTWMQSGLGAAESRSKAREERGVLEEARAGRDGRDAEGADTGSEGRRGSREGTEAKPERGSSTSPSPRTAAKTPAPAGRTHRSTRLSAPLRPRARRLLGRRVNTAPGARPHPARSPAPVPAQCPARSPAPAPAPRPSPAPGLRVPPRPSPASSPEPRPCLSPAPSPGSRPRPEPRIQSGSAAPAPSPASGPRIPPPHRAPRRLGDKRALYFSFLQQPEVASSWLHQVGNLSPSLTRSESFSSNFTVEPKANRK